MEELHVIDNTDLKRFEVRIQNEVAFVEYRFKDGDIILIHTFVPETLRGRGFGSRLIKAVLDIVRNMHLPLKVYCPAITNYIDMHPEYYALLDEELP